MPVFNIHHITKYEYDRPVKESVNKIRIYPFVCSSQEALYHDLSITDQPDISVITDYWGNRNGMFNLMPSHKELTIESKLIVRTLSSSEAICNSIQGFDELKNEVNENFGLLELSRIEEIDLRDTLEKMLKEFYEPAMSVSVAVEKCCNYIFNNFNYIKGITTIETTVEEILEHRSGVCQDFAHAMLEMLRSLQIPSRYVSGYICSNKNGMRGEGATHAWVEAWIPGWGWTGIDPTNNVWVTNNHVKLAVGRNFNDCSPVKGTFKGPARQSLSVFVSVSYEDGATFENITNVKLDSQTSDEDLPDMLETLAGQQQQ
ncbi:MAG: transglutaminase family protein [Bacteroidia bacterium]|nr:transglutaminase family protein [Bacteroidia bacterium]